MVLAIFFLLPLAWAGNLKPPDKPFKLQNAGTGMYVWPIHGNQHEKEAPIVYYGGSGGDNEFLAEPKDGGKCFVLRSATDKKFALVPAYASPANNRNLVFYPNTNDLTHCCCLVAEDKGGGKFVLRHYKQPSFYVHTSGGGPPHSGTKAVFYTGVPSAAGYFKGVPAFGTGSNYGGLSGSALSAATISTALNCPKCPGAKHSFTMKQAQDMLNIHNKMRCATGAPPLQWDCELQCQAQQSMDHCVTTHTWEAPQFGGSFMKWARSNKIQVQENLAWGGNSMEKFAFSWFKEFKKSGPNCGRGKGHFQGITYAKTAKLGCGICTTSAKTMVMCQYGTADRNKKPMKFHCEPQYQKYINMGYTGQNLGKCGLQSMASKYMRLYDDSDQNLEDLKDPEYDDSDQNLEDLKDPEGSLTVPVLALACIMMTVSGALLVWRRRKRPEQHIPEVLSLQAPHDVMLGDVSGDEDLE